jgi:SPP1 family phage portal protein
MALVSFGRKKILRDEAEITPENIAKVLSETFLIHSQNSIDISTLYNEYKGDQDILDRLKTIRPEICNKIVENHANEIVSFKTGYLCGEPIQYVSRGDGDTLPDEIGKLNDMMVLCSKDALDDELAEWMYTCGTGYRMAFPNSEYITNEIVPKLKKQETQFAEDEAPFDVFTLDPRYTYVVYHSGLGEKPLMAVKYVYKQNSVIPNSQSSDMLFSVYTKDGYYQIDGSILGVSTTVPVRTPTALGMIPIVEYPLNNARLGIFEIVRPLLNAINTVASNRADGVEQFIQSLILLYNCDIDDDSAKSLREAGLVKLKSVGEIKADLKILSEQLDQSQTQTLVDYMYQVVLCIVGMPNRNGGTSTSDTGSAVIMRDGWESAEARAKRDETAFKRSERQFLKIVLKIIRGTVGTQLKLSDIEVKFTRRNYSDILSKSQVLVTMLGCDKIAPILAFTHCGMFSDPEDAAKQSAEHYEKVKAEQAKQQTPPNNSKPEGGENIA